MEQMNTRFLPGDIVTVLPYNEIAAKFVRDRMLPSGCIFTYPMEKFCGNDYIVAEVRSHPYCTEVGFYVLCTPREQHIGWTFTDEMLEDIGGVCLETSVDGGILFDDIMNFSE